MARGRRFYLSIRYNIYTANAERYFAWGILQKRERGSCMKVEWTKSYFLRLLVRLKSTTIRPQRRIIAERKMLYKNVLFRDDLEHSEWDCKKKQWNLLMWSSVSFFLLLDYSAKNRITYNFRLLQFVGE